MRHPLHGPSRGDIIRGYIIGLLLIGAGFEGFSKFALQETQRFIAAQSWIETEAKLVAFKIRVIRDDGKGNYSYLRSRNRYVADVKYVYSFDGRQYSGTRVTLETDQNGSTSEYEGLHMTLQAHFRADRPITIFVDPARPYRATIKRSIHWENFVVGLFAASIFGAIGLGFIITGIRNWRYAKP